MSSIAKLGPERQQRSQRKILKLGRRIANSLLDAFCLAISCDCQVPHDVGLQLSRTPITVPGDDDDMILTSLEVHVVLSYAAPNQDSHQPDNPSGIICNKKWRELLVQQEARLPRLATAPSPNILPLQSARGRSVRFMTETGLELESPSTGQTFPHALFRSRVRFASRTRNSPSMTLRRATPSSNSRVDCLPGLATTSTATPTIQEMCGMMHKIGNQRVRECCGCIFDCLTPRGNRYNIRPHSSLGEKERWSLVSLKTVLSDTQRRQLAINNLSYRAKLKLAAALVSNILQLYGTPWLSHPPTHDGIFVAQHQGVYLFQQAFLLTKLPATTSPANIIPTPSAKNPILFALGVLLLELMLNETIKEVTRSQEVLLLDTVNTRCGNNYSDAV